MKEKQIFIIVGVLLLAAVIVLHKSQKKAPPGKVIYSQTPGFVGPNS